MMMGKRTVINYSDNTENKSLHYCAHVVLRYILTSRPCTVLDLWRNLHCYYCKYLHVKLYFNLAYSLYAMRSVMAH